MFVFYYILEYATALAENLANPSHIMSFLLVFIFWLSWTPYIGITIYESITGNIIDNTLLHFGAVWIGILNSFWKVVIMSIMSPQFRLALRIFCMTICCRTKVILIYFFIYLNSNSIVTCLLGTTSSRNIRIRN